MSKVKNFIDNITHNIKTTIVRFPITLTFLVLMTAIMFILIEDSSLFDENVLSRFMFAGIFGAFLSITVRFLLERFENINKYNLFLHGLTVIITIGYYFFMTDNEVTNYTLIHLLVISFALFAAYLYLPSAKNAVNFGNVALAHFKAAFTSILYGAVLYLGIAAILGAVDILLYDINYKLYSHGANIVFVFFTPLYYLSLLPEFNSNTDDSKKDISYVYPKFLDILVSYIAIPLIGAFSGVLIIYFIKILLTGVWPVGQVGPMVLGYSAAGYFIYILSSNLTNGFSINFRRVFPVVLIPLVLMQLISSYIRIEAYGITESRYYVVLFGIFSIVCALMLLLGKRKNPNAIVLLSAFFALISIIPPIDAFNVSKNSQQARLEEILIRNDMLAGNKIVRKSDLSGDDKYEITNISNYMYRMGYLYDMPWYPNLDNDENYYADFKNIYGFEQYYDREYTDQKDKSYINAYLDENEAINIEEFDVLVKITAHSKSSSSGKIGNFTLEGRNYILHSDYDKKGNLTISVFENDNIIIEVSMKEFIEELFEKANENKLVMNQENLTVEKQNDKLKIKILINNINADIYDPDNTYFYMDAFVFVSAP